MMRPDVGWSRPARRPSSVDLPLPEGPATARNCPEGISRETSVRTSTAAAPLARRIERRSMLIIARSYYTSDMRRLFAAWALLLALSTLAHAKDRVIVAF